MTIPGRRSRLLGLGLISASLIIALFIGSALIGYRDRRPDRVEPAATALDPPPDGRVRIEVLNAAGSAGLARRATVHLRDRGFDVVYFGNASDFGLDSTIVIDRVGQLEDAEAVARALGVERVRSEPDSTLLLEVTILLGRDWAPEETDRPTLP